MDELLSPRDKELLNLWSLDYSFAEIAEKMSRISQVRRGGKTAFVYDRPLEYGIGRMFQSFSEMADMPFEVQSFQSFEEAKAWLGV